MCLIIVYHSDKFIHVLVLFTSNNYYNVDCVDDFEQLL